MPELIRKPRRVLLMDAARRKSPLRAWRLRASKWHPGWPHDEDRCCYEEWLLAQPRWYRRLPEGRREELAAMPRAQRAKALR